MEEVNLDWDDLLDVADMDSLFDSVPNNQVESPLDDIENFLLNDDHHKNLLEDDIDINEKEFFNDIFVDQSPPSIPNNNIQKSASSSSDLSDEDDLLNKNQNQKKNGSAANQQKEEEEEEEDDHNDDDDPLTKKRKRQLRNKDAALRSRERKKSYVKELEMKSRYYEDECRRLGSILQCFMAENQALRFSLHTSNLTSNTTSVTKQESAVLFLESLLLGSLLWLMAVVCQLLDLPEVNAVEEKLLPSPVVLRKGPSEEAFMQILMVGKRFKASRSRMRPTLYDSPPLKVVNNLLLAVF